MARKYPKPWYMYDDPADQEAAYREQTFADFNGDPMTDPKYNQFYSNIMAAGGMDLANSQEAIRQALISFGVIPEGWQDSLGVLDDRTRDLINKNTQAGLSTYAMLEEARNTSIKDLIGNLSARGLRRSGAKGAGLRKRQKEYDRNKSSALSRLLAQLRGVYNSYAMNEMGRQNALQQAGWDFYSNWQSPYESDWSNYDWSNPWTGDDGGAGNEPSPNEKIKRDRPGIF